MKKLSFLAIVLLLSSCACCNYSKSTLLQQIPTDIAPTVTVVASVPEVSALTATVSAASSPPAITPTNVNPPVSTSTPFASGYPLKCNATQTTNQANTF